jgi:hypothetical protein
VDDPTQAGGPQRLALGCMSDFAQTMFKRYLLGKLFQLQARYPDQLLRAHARVPRVGRVSWKLTGSGQCSRNWSLPILFEGPVKGLKARPTLQHLRDNGYIGPSEANTGVSSGAFLTADRHNRKTADSRGL